MKRLFVMVLLTVLVLTSCSLTGDKNIAVVNGNKISADELYRYIPQANFNALSPEEKQTQVDQICDDYLARYYLEEMGDLDSGDVYWEIRVWEIRELANGAYQNLIIDKILNDKAMNDLYEKMKYELNVSHLLIGYNEGSRKLNDRNREEAETLIRELADSINGDNFKDLVMKYSDDGSKENNAGDLGWAKTGQWVEAFENAAFALKPGEISEPVETPFGFHLIKLNERREIPIAPYEELEADLIELAYSRWRTKFIDRQNEVFDSLTVANPLVIDSLKLEDFLDRYGRLSRNVFYSEQFTTFDIMDIFSDTLCVGKLGDISLDKDWIVEYLKMISLQVPPRFTDSRSFGSLMDQSRMGALLNKAAINLGLDKGNEFKRTKNVFLAKKASSLFDKLYVYELINPSKEALHDFYENKKAELYSLQARVKVREILVNDKEEANKLLKRIRAGEDMGDLASEHSLRNIGKNNQGIIPPVKKNQYGEMSLAAFNMKDGEIGGPYKIGEHYSIIQRIELIPEEYRSLENISYRLLTDYRSNHMEIKREEQKKMLRNKYSVRINRSFVE